MTQTPSLKTQLLQVDGMDCGSCAKTIEASLQQLNGVMEASVSFATAKVKVFYDSDILDTARIINRITALGYTVKPLHHHDHEHLEVASTLEAKVGGMDCGSCAKTVEVGLQQIAGVLQVSVSFGSGRMQVSYNPQQVDKEIIYGRVRSLGYTVELIDELSSHQHSHDCNHDHHHDQPHSASWEFWVKNRRGQSLILMGVGLVLGLLTQYLALPIWVARAFYGIGIVIAGYPMARAGLLELRLRRADMNLLMTISVVGALILGDWFEAALVLFLFSCGTTLQVFTFGRTRNAIHTLMDLTPSTATVKRGEREVAVPVESVQVGEILTIRPGQRVALDGVVVAGVSTIDQSAITGESIPEDKAVGDLVFAGTFNQSGFLAVQVTHTARDTTVAKIIHLVETAQESRAPSQQWVDRFAEVYTPMVILMAIAIFLIPPLAFAQPGNVWFYRALVMLVIACPCALVISTPVSIVSAIGAATRQGILFKGGYALETAGRMTTLAFDKTGTITQGLPTVQKIYGLGQVSADQVLQIAATLEQHSEHPLAKAILAQAQETGIDLAVPVNFMALPGKGIQADVHEVSYLVGNRRLFSDQGIPLADEAESLATRIERLGQIPVLVGTKQGLLGVIALADSIRLEATEAVRQLKLLGLKELVMLTGDRTRVAKQIAQQVEISEYRAELLPEDKLQEIQRLRRGGVVGMVGDGINDAPALASADISFAVGGIDIALETADVVIVGGDLRRIASAVQLSRRTVSVIQQNVVFSLVTKGIFLLLGTFGLVGLGVAVLADTGTSLLVTANGMRLFKTRKS